MENNKIHDSHVMSEWESTVVTLISTPRFGRVRHCIHCNAEHAETVAGSVMHEELKVKCEGAIE